MLEACHIADWSADIKNRLNPTNGICLNSLFHKAYDKNYLGITPDYKIVISDRLFEETQNGLKIIDFFFQYNKKQIMVSFLLFSVFANGEEREDKKRDFYTYLSGGLGNYDSWNIDIGGWYRPIHY